MYRYGQIVRVARDGGTASCYTRPFARIRYGINRYRCLQRWRHHLYVYLSLSLAVVILIFALLNSAFVCWHRHRKARGRKDNRYHTKKQKHRQTLEKLFVSIPLSLSSPLSLIFSFSLFYSVLIVDEISMVEPQVFDVLEEVARGIRKDPRPFGGIQIILCGDFLQLPPVSKVCV